VGQPSAYDIDIGVTLSARDAFTNVLRYAGARWWERDYDFTVGNTNAIDTISERVIHDVITGKGRIQAWADDPFNLSGTYQVQGAYEGAEWRALWALRTTNGVPPFQRAPGWDTDQDGMPDHWEVEHGLDPNVPNNNADFDNDGYTDLEEYLNDVSAWPAPGVIRFTGEEDDRYARIFNWRVYGLQLNITNLGNVTTFSYWQPSRFDTVLISNGTVVVDAVGQQAGILQLANNSVLNITNGWINVAKQLEVGTNCTVNVTGPASVRVTNSIINNGTIRLVGDAELFIGGFFTNNGILDVIAWSHQLPVGLVNNGVVLDRSSVRIESVEVNGADVVIKIHGYEGHAYQLQYRDELSVGTWQFTGLVVTGENVPISFVYTNGAGALRRFYRVAVN